VANDRRASAVPNTGWTIKLWNIKNFGDRAPVSPEAGMKYLRIRRLFFRSQTGRRTVAAVVPTGYFAGRTEIAGLSALLRRREFHIDESLALQGTVFAHCGLIGRMPHDAERGAAESRVGTLNNFCVQDLASLIEDGVHDHGLDLAVVAGGRRHEFREAERTDHDCSRTLREHLVGGDKLIEVLVGVGNTVEMNLQDSGAALHD
jgi:hypothetical protein